MQRSPADAGMKAVRLRGYLVETSTEVGCPAGIWPGWAPLLCYWRRLHLYVSPDPSAEVAPGLVLPQKRVVISEQRSPVDGDRHHPAVGLALTAHDRACHLE